MAELNSRCCLWRDAVPLAGCAADVALLEARLQATRLLSVDAATSDPGRDFARAISMYVVACITLWEAYDQMKLTEKSRSIAASVELEIRQLLAAWFLLPVDLCSRLIAYFERETLEQSHDSSVASVAFRDDGELKPFLLRQAELACLLHPLTTRISMMYRAERIAPVQRLPC
ncbi:hypothetical protein GCM10022278_04070 [Allohahella marinimesophila]|uniref:RiboL-PSP-HEPN domain-containing protein n=2 Tax=Allohahella marinimesophila TaxID=1054972 RepID=A0ABP7NK97_9GAMM